MKSKKILKNIMKRAAVAAIMACSFMLPDAGMAATMPTFDSLPPISVQNPTSNRDLSNIAVGVDGHLYVTESNRHNIAILTSEGAGIGSITGITNPLGVAVNSKGNVYVSSLADKSVVIRNSQGASLGQLGAGKNEFKRPVFVAIDQQNDEVYVVDANASAIKVYSETGTYLRTITDANAPLAAAVYGNELYVLDQPLASGVATSKIRVYNKTTGVELTSFGTYGIEVGQMKQPKAITVDASGRLFVVEFFHRVVYCYDGPNRLYLGAVYNNANNALNMPMGVGVSKSGKLFVVDRAEDNLKVFGLDNYTSLSVTPDSFSFALTNGVSTPASGTLSLANTGKGILSYAVSTSTDDGAAWIQLSGTSGTIPAISGTAVQTVTMNGTGLVTGSYIGSITVQDIDNSTVPATVRFEKKIPVTLTVNNPAFQISATTMAFETAPESSAMMSKDLTVTLSGDSTNAITWMATAATNGAANWLSVSPSAQTGNSATTVTVTADPAGLAAGSYTGTITFRAPGASGAPAALQVSLIVVKANSAASVSESKNIIVTVPGSKRAGSKIQIFNSSLAVVKEITPFGSNYKGDMTVAAGDVDGDGYDEIIVAYGASRVIWLELRYLRQMARNYRVAILLLLINHSRTARELQQGTLTVTARQRLWSELAREIKMRPLFGSFHTRMVLLKTPAFMLFHLARISA